MPTESCQLSFTNRNYSLLLISIFSKLFNVKVPFHLRNASDSTCKKKNTFTNKTKSYQLNQSQILF